MIRIPYIFVAACVAFAVGAGWYVQQPMRARLPDKALPVAGIKGPLEKLGAPERVLVAGYLLRQRGEVVSLRMRDDGPFTARTFGEAIPLQRAFLQANGYNAASLVRIGLADQALRPLREAVDVVAIEAGITTRREMFNIHPMYATRRGGPDAVAEEDKPLLKVAYILRNLTDSDVEVTGAVDVRKATHPSSDRGALTTCAIQKKAIPARTRERVECVDTTQNSLAASAQFLLNATEADLYVVWTPQEIRFADGRTLTYNELAAAQATLWGFYSPGKMD